MAQMRKQNWKKIRDVNPCRLCGGDHTPRNCPVATKKGKSKVSKERERY